MGGLSGIVGGHRRGSRPDGHIGHRRPGARWGGRHGAGADRAGGALTSVLGSALADALADYADVRENEVYRDLLENIHGYWGGRQTYSGLVGKISDFASWASDEGASMAISAAPAPGRATSPA